MDDDPHQALLESGRLAGCHLDGLFVQVDDLVVQSRAEHGLFRSEKPFPGDFLGQRALETDPVFLPAGRRIGPVGVPFAREEEEETAFSDGDGMRVRGTPELTGAAGQVEELVFVQDAAALFGEEVAGRVVGRGIWLPGRDFLEPDGIDGGSLEEIVGTGDKVFQVNGLVHGGCG
jgi:hypothetical protein